MYLVCRLLLRSPLVPTFFPYTTLFRSREPLGSIVLAEPVTAIGDGQSAQHLGPSGHPGRSQQVEGPPPNRGFDPFGRESEAMLPELGQRPIPVRPRHDQPVGPPQARPARIRRDAAGEHAIVIGPTRVVDQHRRRPIAGWNGLSNPDATFSESTDDCLEPFHLVRIR